MLNETILGKISQSKTSHQITEREEKKGLKKNSHKPISTKVVTIWGLFLRSFNTLELLSRKITPSSFSFYSLPLSAPAIKVILRHFFAVSFVVVVLCFFGFLGPHPWHMKVPGLGGPIRAVATVLHHSHSNAGSEPHLQPAPQLMVTPYT